MNNVSTPEWDEEHEHTDEELMALLPTWQRPFAREWLNERMRVLKDVRVVEVFLVPDPAWGSSVRAEHQQRERSHCGRWEDDRGRHEGDGQDERGVVQPPGPPS
jgi:hypothetical protein